MDFSEIKTPYKHIVTSTLACLALTLGDLSGQGIDTQEGTPIVLEADTLVSTPITKESLTQTIENDSLIELSSQNNTKTEASLLSDSLAPKLDQPHAEVPMILDSTGFLRADSPLPLEKGSGDGLMGPDSASIANQVNFINDDPILEMIDSIVNVKYFNNLHFTTDTAILNVYNFTPDSVPAYDSSVYESRLAHLNGQTPFSLRYNDHVHAFINVYAVKRREQVARMLGLAELYFPMFEELLDQYDLPLELKYLAIAESALNPRVRSRSGAVGLWQFMYSTGKIYKLNVTSYVDERRDPYKSTVAACKYLSYLYNLYSDWDLALAAYNSGPGRVNRAIRRSGGKRDYWELWRYLPRETRGYVPAFIAVNYIMNYASDHNIYPIAPKYLNYETDTVIVKQRVSFSQISTVLNIPVEDIEFLNPVYKSGIIPYNSRKAYALSLPTNKIGDFINNEQVIYNYKTPEQLIQDSIAAGQKSVASSPTVISTSKNNKGTRINHVVKEGEVLGLIAERYKCSIRDIKYWNNIGGTRIYAGKKLIIYTSVKTTQIKPKSTTSTAVKKDVTVMKGLKKYVYHTVQSGDTLWDIAKLYEGVTVKQIKILNNIYNVKKLKPGMKIKIAVTSS
ncbi:MAG: lytic transglycosylase [Bacteroidetes bacterium]|nr:MAG: lytic transglycosylase [Bacteroidota bacterium]